jgi:hypothetical protein
LASKAPTAPVNADAVSTLGQRWYVLIIMMLAYTINIADRYVMSTVLEPIRLELGLTDGGVAFLTGVSLALFYVTMGVAVLGSRPVQQEKSTRSVDGVLVGYDGAVRDVARLYAALARQNWRGRRRSRRDTVVQRHCC